MKTTQIVALWTFGLWWLVPAQAFDILGMRSAPNTIQTATEASKLPVGTPLIFMCDSCKGSEVMVVDEKKTILTWFNALKTKKCPGSCGGLVNYVNRATSAGREFPDTYNTCSRCRRPTISWSVAKPGTNYCHQGYPRQFLAAQLCIRMTSKQYNKYEKQCIIYCDVYSRLAAYG
jgi:hypothetical protein